MKSKFLQVMKAIALSVSAAAIITVGSISLPNGVKAAETTVDYKDSTSGVQYVKYSNIDYDTYFGKCAPEYNAVDSDGVGYVFGGWYEKNESTYTAIQNKEALNSAKESDAVVAKFVPAQTLSVKCQNWAGTNADSDEVIVRVISAVDSVNYQGYGFEISKIEGGKEKTLGTYESKDQNKVYSRFNYYKNAEDTKPAATYEASDLFGKAAQYFTTCTIGKIPQNAHSTIICIKPFWKTLDGTTVYGLSRFAHVEDGYLNYVNVPVNINFLSENNGAVAGILNVRSSNGLAFVGAEYGKLFEEMEFHQVTDSEGNIVVRCVGNASDVSKEKKTMDLYINLRFQGKPVDDASGPSHYIFTVTDEEFCDSTKNIIQNADVWNVKY